MDILIFSQTAIFRLQQLGSAYYHSTGERHRLATESGILDLLKSSALVSDKKVRAAYDAFVMELNKRQIDALAARSIKLRLPMHTSLVTHIRQAG
ncbi:hypothetical protein [Cellvibrio sp.]|uniref:hypothetical protein n=1 Tax=Cellvibrio sp. TaxID=1965322 RepID=UPI0039648016